MKRPIVVVACVVAALSVSACGSDDDAAPTTASPESEQQTADPTPAGGEPEAPAGETVVERPGCGELCQQAGPPAGTDSPGCPGDDSDNCAPCPEGGCAEILTDAADVQDGIFNVDMACKADHRCVGALHVYFAASISDPVAASDVDVQTGETATVPIALTPFGRHVVGVDGDFEGSAYVFLEGTGVDDLGAHDGPPTVRLSAAQEELLQCGREIQVARTTSCPFARNVVAAYGEGTQYFKAHSPAMGRSYQMSCHPDAATVYCTGGNDAFVTFPQESQ
jgi:hypothetical protein